MFTAVWKDHYQLLLDHLLEAVYIVDRSRRICYWNQMAEKLSGFSKEEVVGHSCQEDILVHVNGQGQHLCLGLCPLAKTMEDGQQRSSLIFMHHKDGYRLPVHVKTVPLYGENGEIVGGMELFNVSVPIDESLKRTQELERLSYLDELIRIPNRRYFITTLQRKLVEWEHFGARSAVFIADIDGFNDFNNRYGQQAGDQVLKMVAMTMIKSMRGDDLCCRWSGEEFVGIVQTGKSEALKEILERIRMLVENSYIIDGENRLQVTLSFGGTVVRRSDREESWIKRAESLLQESKRKGCNQITVD
ncbi:MAG TPA: diguanylate cyclase [Thermotogota bacterium]|nr:diguanylate cyclase [Thermotogota bacterium]